MAAWVFILIISLAAPAKMAALPSFPGWSETEAEWTEREQAIANDIAAVTTDPREMAVLVAIAFHEARFAKDADVGPCYRGPRGDSSRCDFGKASSIFQIRAMGPDDMRKLFADRRHAARRALEMVRRSAAACVPRHGADAALRAYSSGTCLHGVKESNDMVRLARRLLANHPPSKTSAEELAH